MILGKLKQAQFYINNVCNLTCPNCASFNNLSLSGNFLWNDNRIHYEKWAELLEFDELAILGGEPLLHPDLDSWVFGLRKLYPQVEDFRITTHGLLLSKNKEKIKSYLDVNTIIECSVHRESDWISICDSIEEILQSTSFEITKFEDVWYYKQGNKTFFEVRRAWNFTKNAIDFISDGVVYLHKSDPIVAHENCDWNDCHYFVNGRLYKCVVTATAQFLNSRYTLDENSKDLISKIRSVDPDDSIESIKSFIDNIENYCEQCSLCPESSKFEKIILPPKKIKV